MVRNKSSLLIDEPPLMVLPSLAKAIGLNEAIFVQQLHWLLQHSGKKVKGQEGVWVYNTIQEWQERFTFWSDSTIKRIVKELKKEGILRVGRFNRMQLDQTRWYSLDYEALNKKTPIGSSWHDGLGQVDPMTLGQSDPMLPKSKTTNQRKENGVTEPPAAAAELNETTEGALMAALSKLNKSIKQKGGNPITGVPVLAKRLHERGVTVEDMRAAWTACKSNAEKPVGAFVKWVNEGWVPPSKGGHETMIDENGRTLMWIDMQGWVATGSRT